MITEELCRVVCGELYLKFGKKDQCLGKVLFHVAVINKRLYRSATLASRPSFSPSKHRAMVLKLSRIVRERYIMNKSLEC